MTRKIDKTCLKTLKNGMIQIEIGKLNRGSPEKK